MQKRYKHDKKNTWINHSILHVHRLLVNKRMIVIRNNKDYMTIHQTKAKPLKLSNKKPKQKQKSFPMHQKPYNSLIAWQLTTQEKYNYFYFFLKKSKLFKFQLTKQHMIKVIYKNKQDPPPNKITITNTNTTIEIDHDKYPNQPFSQFFLYNIDNTT